MSPERDPEKGNGRATAESSSGSSTLTANSSPPRTPPEDDSEDGLPRIQHAPHSSQTPKRGRRSKNNSPPTRLGAIDEDSNAIAPDIPARNPNRIFGAGAAKLFGFGLFASSKGGDEDVPPPNAYDTITGPRGEKFTDVRRNRPSQNQSKRSSKKLKILGVILVVLVILGIALGVGLGVGLSKKKSSNSSSDSSGSNDNKTTPFPIGQFQMRAYLTSTSTNCTSNSATWSCYPYTGYSASNPSQGLTSMTWSITSPTDSTGDLLISNNNPTFSYPFTNVSLALSDSGSPSLAAYIFSFSYRKVVAPATSLTSDNVATRCYFNDTLVSVRLYVDSQGAGGNVVSTAQGSNAWPYAFEYAENSGDGPECFEYVNGANGQSVDISVGSGICQCAYRNYGLS